jgi:transcription initiation factor TFIID TATA-box-binding protein
MRIVNIVATVKLSAPLDLQNVLKSVEGTKCNPKVHWLQLRIPPDNTYIAFYQSGKFLVTAKSMGKLQKNIDIVLKLLKNAGIDVRNTKTSIHNLVINHQIEFKSSIENLIQTLDPKKASYEPEQFPALNYKDWGVSFLLFSTGSCIITGAKSEKQASEAIQNFQDLLNRCT